MTEISSPTAPADTKTPSAGAWLFATLGLVALFVGLNLLLAWKLDIFGMLRDTHGRHLITARHERQAKYLLNYYYVPENFDALVIGASSSANWKLEGLSQYRFYNESMLGANGTEERMLVEKALERGHFKIALVAIARGVTDRSDLQDGLDQVDPHEALGSFYFYIKVLDRLHDLLSHRRSDFYPDGSWEFPQHKMPPIDPNAHYTPTKLDPKAVEDYQIMIRELMAHGTRIVYVVSPHYGPSDGSKEILSQYTKDMLAILPPAPVIDLTEDRYAALNDNPDLMIDADHLSDAGVPIYSKLVIERLHEVLHDQ
jgi:hypothetical protein